MKVVLSADSTDEGDTARRWCADHLDRRDTVIAVAGINQVGELVMGVPPFDSLGGERELLTQIEHDYCSPLDAAGVVCTARITPAGQARAVAEVAVREAADLIVVGKRAHGPIADAFLGEVASQLVHHPPCPVVVVPCDRATARAEDPGLR
jgi:nucleotide-binding universal stress UspA family protein